MISILDSLVSTLFFLLTVMSRITQQSNLWNRGYTISPRVQNINSVAAEGEVSLMVKNMKILKEIHVDRADE